MSLVPDSNAQLHIEPSQREIKQTIFSLVWPVTTENVLQFLIGFVNTAMVGRLGAAAILAVGLSGRIGMFVWIIFSAIGTGTTVLIARAFGAGDNDRVRDIAHQGLITSAALMGLVAAIVFAFAPNFMTLLGATPESMAMGVTYLRILVFSIPFQAIFMVISAIMRGMGDTRTPMQVALAINLVNVSANSLLIFGNLGFPALGFRGPAVSTILAQATGAFLAGWFLFRRRSSVDFGFERGISIRMPLVRRILGIGVPASAEMFFWQIASVLIFRLVNDFGTVAGAAYQLGLQAEGISYMPAAGFGIAATTLVGRSLGAGDPNLAERYVRQMVRWSVTLTACTTAILVFCPRLLMSMLTNDREVIELGAQYLLIMGLSQIPQQITGVLGGTLRGAGDTLTPMVAAALGIWGCRIPLGYLLSRTFGLPGIWWAINIDQFVRLGVVAWRYRRGTWKTQLGEEPEIAQPEIS
ncbi:MAG TPA: MATE family efflux transporter [Bacillota bacterium]|nr:MATE family efflux transporter [Bacillota bacterium]